MIERDFCKDVLFGVSVGDALGVPAEFKSRQTLSLKPVTTVQGYGSHNVPAGTWSDDSSLTFCLADALADKYDLQSIADNFVRWRYNNLWTAHNEVFDIGIATQQAIERIDRGVQPALAGGFDVYENGNGSLMRILPLVFHVRGMPIAERFETVREVSSITHGHIRSVIACFYYIEFALQLIDQKPLKVIYRDLQSSIVSFLLSTNINRDEIALFNRLLKGDIVHLKEDEIRSTGYVLYTLEASVWCILNSDNYKEAVLRAINLGDDTDTTAAVTGGLAGLLYGYKTIPEEWMLVLARRDDIAALAERLSLKYNNQHA